MEEYDIKPSHLKYKTPDDIRIALALKPWDEFAIESIQYWLGNPLKIYGAATILKYIYDKRRTGQTTKMLIEAVFESQSKTVYITGNNKAYTSDLVFAAREICNQLGLDGGRIQPTPPNSSADFVDHYKGDKV